jgi:aminomethyltransferase
MNEAAGTRKTPLYEEHEAAGGRMVDFAGFRLPVQYTSVSEEHRAVRERAGLFDVSHMGEIAIRGPGALAFLQLVSCNDHSKMAIGRAQYTGLMYPEGTFVDDVLVHKMNENDFLLVVNAANRGKDLAYLSELAEPRKDVQVLDLSDENAQLALQGPLAQEVLQPISTADLGTLKYYRFTHGEVAGERALIARTGYTGEDGFEMYIRPEAAPHVWRAILEAGRSEGVKPAGLGARDTLRFEAGMCLYGNDIDATVTPLEAGLAWIVKLEKDDFIGRDVLERQADEGVERRLVGLEVTGRGIARHGYPIRVDGPDGEAEGLVTSGTQSPTLGKALAMAYLPSRAATVGREVFVEIRNRAVGARVVDLPFYSRKKK